MKSTTQFHRGLKTFAVKSAALLLALACANIASAQNNTGPGSANGTSAGASFTSGTDNTAYGFSALQSDTTGSRNTAVGSLTLQNNIAGGNNTAVGYGALTVSIASNNTAL